MARDQLVTAPLNKLPRGLLDFFGIQSFGQNPMRLDDHLAPVVDLLRWYAQSNATQTIQVPAITVGAGSGNGGTFRFPATTPVDFGNGTRSIVPNDEVWFCTEFVTKAVYAVGADLGEFWPALTDFPNGQTRPQPSSTSSLASGTAAFQRVFWASMDTPIFIPPGTEFAAYTSGYTSAGAMLIEAHLKVLRLRA